MILKFDEYIKLNEANVNIPYDYMISLLIKLGWTHKNTHDVQHEFNKTIIKDGKPYTMQMTTHFHGNSRNVNPAFLVDVKKRLMTEYEITGDDKYIRMVDWSRLGMINPILDKIETEKQEKQEIDFANKEYKNAELFKINMGVKDSCYIINNNGEYNTCVSPDDRRPLLDEWFEDIDNVSGKYILYKLGDKYMEGYPVNNDGSLDYDNKTLEESHRIKKFKLL